MPWSPSFEGAVPDPRLDPYRNRAAHLMDGEAVAGHVLVETDFSADGMGGALWWRRWATPKEFAVVFTKIDDGEARTTSVGNDDLDLFSVWEQAGYADGDRKLTVVWLDDSDSQRVHDEVFGHQH